MPEAGEGPLPAPVRRDTQPPARRQAPPAPPVQGEGGNPSRPDRPETPRPERGNPHTDEPEEPTGPAPDAPELTVNIAAAKHKIDRDGEKGEEILEQVGKQAGRMRMTEEKKQWEASYKPWKKEGWKNLGRRMKNGIYDHYARNKAAGQELVITAGVDRAISYEFQQEIREVAEKNRDEKYNSLGRKEKVKSTIHRAREIEQEELLIMKGLREGTVGGARQTGQDAFVDKLRTDHPDLFEQYKDTLTGDAQASEALAQRLSKEMGDDAIRTAIGEKRVDGEESDLEITGDLKDFFVGEVLKPMLEEGLRTNGNISEDTLLTVRAKVKDAFLTKSFVEWRNGLSEDVRAKFDQSLSYGTDIVPLVEEILLPDALAKKAHLRSTTNLDEYTKNVVLKVNLGTLKAGAETTIEEGWVDRMTARHITNERVAKLYQEVAAGTEPQPHRPNAYTSALEDASKKANLVKYGANHVAAGVVVGVGLYAAQSLARRGAGALLPMVGGTAAGAAIRGWQERGRFTREQQQVSREMEEGIVADPEAKRRKEMVELSIPKIDINDTIEALAEGREALSKGTETEDDLLGILGALAERQARYSLMNELGVGLYSSKGNQLEQQRTQLTLLNARARVDLQDYFGNNQHQVELQAIAARIGGMVQIGDPVGSIIDQLAEQQRQNIQEGTGIDPNVTTAFGLTSVAEGMSIDGRDKAFASARRTAMLKQAGGTLLAGIGGSLVTQEVFALAGRGIGLDMQTTMAERLVGQGNRHANEAAGGVILDAAAAGHASELPKPEVMQDVLSDITKDVQDKLPGTHVIQNDTGGWNILDAHNKVLIDNATLDAKGHFSYDAAKSMLDPNRVNTLMSELKIITPDQLHAITIPDGTHWDYQDGQWNLIADKDPSQVLIHNASLSKGEFTYDVKDSLIKDPEIIQQTPGTPEAIKKNVLGPDGIWKENEQKIKEWQWYGYDTEQSDRNELRFETFKHGDSITLQMRGMEYSEASNLDPSKLYVPDVQQHGQAAFAMTLPGHENDPLVLLSDTKGQLNLNPDSTDPKDVVRFMHADGKITTMQNGEFSKMILNPDAYNHEPDGQIQTEVEKTRSDGSVRQLRETFNLGGNDGEGRGRISAGRLQMRNGHPVWQSFATIFGTGDTPPTAETQVPGPTKVTIPPINIGSAEQAHVIPTPFIPLVTPRRPLEAGVSTEPEYVEESLGVPPEAPLPYYGTGEFPRRPDGTPATLADFIRRRRPDEMPPVVNEFSPSASLSSEITSSSEDGETALREIRDTFDRTPHMYVVFSGPIGDAVITTAYVEGLREYADRTAPGKRITLVVPPHARALLEPLAGRYNCDIIEGTNPEVARNQIARDNESDALIFDFHHQGDNPILSTLPNNGLELSGLGSASVALYTQNRSGNEKFSDFLGDLLSIPEGERPQISPRIGLPANQADIFAELQREYNIDSSKKQVGIVVEASHKMKRYSLDQWRQALEQIAQQEPNTEFNIMYNGNPESSSYTEDELHQVFDSVPGARLVTGDLVQQTVLMSHLNVLLSNDTGLSHIGSALEPGPQVISLHIPQFSPNIWVSNTDRHQGLLPDSSQLRDTFDAETEDEHKKWINRIAPTEISSRVITALEHAAPIPAEVRERQIRDLTIQELLDIRPVIETGPHVGVSTEASSIHPDRNEDAVFALAQQRAGGVFDGMGGHAAGDVASQIGMAVTQRRMQEMPSDDELTQDIVENRIRAMLFEANDEILTRGADPRLSGMGTTATVRKIWNNGDQHFVTIGNVADSRAYIRHADGHLELLTQDDYGSRYNRYTDRDREILNTTTSLSDLPQNERAHAQDLFNTRNQVMQYLGSTRFSPQILTRELPPGAQVLIMTDGGHDNLTTEEIANILNTFPDPKEASAELLRRAQRRSNQTGTLRAKADDMTFEISADEPQPEPRRETNEEAQGEPIPEADREQIIAREKTEWTKVLGKDVEVKPLPDWVTEKQLQKLQEFGLELTYVPEIASVGIPANGSSHMASQVENNYPNWKAKNANDEQAQNLGLDFWQTIYSLTPLTLENSNKPYLPGQWIAIEAMPKPGRGSEDYEQSKLGQELGLGERRARFTSYKNIEAHVRDHGNQVLTDLGLDSEHAKLRLPDALEWNLIFNKWKLDPEKKNRTQGYGTAEWTDTVPYTDIGVPNASRHIVGTTGIGSSAKRNVVNQTNDVGARFVVALNNM